MIVADKKKEAKKYVEEATKVQKQAEVDIFSSKLELHPAKEGAGGQEVPVGPGID